MTDSLADDECLLPTYPDSHELSIHLVVVVAGTANAHPQEAAVGNERPNSHAITRTYEVYQITVSIVVTSKQELLYVTAVLVLLHLSVLLHILVYTCESLKKKKENRKN